MEILSTIDMGNGVKVINYRRKELLKYEPIFEREMFLKIMEFSYLIRKYSLNEYFENIKLDIISQKTKQLKKGLEQGLLDKLLISEGRESVLDDIEKGILFTIKCYNLRKNKNKHIESKMNELMEQLRLLMDYNFFFNDEEIQLYCSSDQELKSFIIDYQNPIPVLK